jgi:predicted dehydrogenase
MGNERSAKNNWQSVTAASIATASYLDEMEGQLLFTTGEHHPYTSAHWPTGHSIGYEHTFINLMVNFMQGISTGVSPSPSFEDGLRNQYVLEAVEQSILSRQWASVQSM